RGRARGSWRSTFTTPKYVMVGLKLADRRTCATFFRHLCDLVVTCVNLTTVAPCRQARNAMPPKEIPMPFTIDIYLAAFSAILLAGWGVSTWLWSRREQAQKQQLATLAGQLRAREEQ